MNIRRLKEIINDLPDEMRLYLPGNDHSYEEASVLVVPVVYEKGGIVAEDGGQTGVRDEVLLVQ